MHQIMHERHDRTVDMRLLATAAAKGAGQEIATVEAASAMAVRCKVASGAIMARLYGSREQPAADDIAQCLNFSTHAQ